MIKNGVNISHFFYISVCVLFISLFLVPSIVPGIEKLTHYMLFELIKAAREKEAEVFLWKFFTKKIQSWPNECLSLIFMRQQCVDQKAACLLYLKPSSQNDPFSHLLLTGPQAIPE